jgi:hypothetical protein
MLTGQAVQLTWQAVRTMTWLVRTGHVASSGRDTCHAFLAFSTYVWANWEVTRVTTGWVTRGTRVTSAFRVAGDVANFYWFAWTN